jgi:membrane protease YdiL (CAAX protease family)
MNLQVDAQKTSCNLRWVWLFIASTFLLSALFDYPIFGQEALSSRPGAFLWLVMWCPGAVALGMLFLRKTTVRGLGLTTSGRAFLAWGLALPLVVCVPIYLAATVGGFCGLAPMALKGHGLSLLLLLPGKFGRALGEELGWRGFLFPQLRKQFSFQIATLITGFIWGLWHFPGIVQGGYQDAARVPLGLSLLFFTVFIMGNSFLYSWLRERSDSLWPVVCFHGMFNWFTQSIMGYVLLPHANTSLALGEMSLGFVAMGLLLAWIFWKGGMGNSTIRGKG